MRSREFYGKHNIYAFMFNPQICYKTAESIYTIVEKMCCMTQHIKNSHTLEKKKKTFCRANWMGIGWIIIPQRKGFDQRGKQKWIFTNDSVWWQMFMVDLM